MAERIIEQPALYGGKDCVGDAVKIDKCRNRPCPGIRECLFYALKNILDLTC